MDQRIIKDRLYDKRPGVCAVTGQSFFRWSEYSKVELAGHLRKNKRTGLDENVVDLSGWVPQRTWRQSPAERLAALGRALNLLRVLPRTPTAVETEISRLRSAGYDHYAARLEKEHPPAPPRMIEPEGALFTVNEETAEISKQGHTLLVFGSDEIREFLTRHVLGQWGEFLSPSAVILTDDSNWIPQLYGVAYENVESLRSGFGLVRSRHNVYRSGADGPDESNPGLAAHAGTPHSRKRNREDWLEACTLIVDGKPTRTVMFTSRDQFLSPWN
jgi:hypothetical protein